MLAQASTGLIETWWVSKLGPDALAGVALVFPGAMMMGMLSAGAIGGGVASAIARALGAGRRQDADALVIHALWIHLALGLATSAFFLVFGRQIYSRDGRARRLVGGGAHLFQRHLRRQCADLDHERAGERHSRQRQHGLSLVRHLPRRRAARADLAFADLRLRPVPGARHRRRRRRRRRDHGADDGDARLVHGVRREPRPPAPRAAALGVLRRHPARRRRRLAVDAADDADGGADDGDRRRRGGAGRRRRLRHRLAARISADPARVRARRAAGGDGRGQYRRRPAGPGAADRDDRRGAELCGDRGRSASPRRSGRGRGSACSATIR